MMVYFMDQVRIFLGSVLLVQRCDQFCHASLGRAGKHSESPQPLTTPPDQLGISTAFV